MYNSSMRTIQREIVGAFIFSSDSKLLLGKTNVYRDLWVVPGGGVNEGESYRSAVVREILEETGLDISTAFIEQVEIDLSGESPKTLKNTGEKVIVAMRFYNFVVKLSKPSNELNLKPSDDLIEARWFEVSKLKDLPLSPPTKTSLIKMGFL